MFNLVYVQQNRPVYKIKLILWQHIKNHNYWKLFYSSTNFSVFFLHLLFYFVALRPSVINIKRNCLPKGVKTEPICCFQLIPRPLLAPNIFQKLHRIFQRCFLFNLISAKLYLSWIRDSSYPLFSEPKFDPSSFSLIVLNDISGSFFKR